LKAGTNNADLHVGQRLPTLAQDTSLDVAGDLLSGGTRGREERQY
jgi:hypothetical protein